MRDKVQQNQLHGIDYNAAPATSRWVAFVKRESTAAVTRPVDETVMSFPHLILREIVLLEIMVIVLSILALWLNAPLEAIANPDHSPNPAKAPWYFLGLQELLHYFPPVVAGVLLPLLVIIALVVIPYIDINIKQDSFWQGNLRARFYGLLGTTTAIVLLLWPFHAWPIIIPTVLVSLTMVWPYLRNFRNARLQRWASAPLAHWIMIWFLSIAATLTMIGVFFRGPEWRWIWPWIDGVY